MPSVCEMTSPSTTMENFTFSLDTQYGSITFQFKDGSFSLSFTEGFRIQDCFNDNPPQPIEGASPPTESKEPIAEASLPTKIKDCIPSTHFAESKLPKTKAKQEDLPLKAACNIPRDAGRSSSIMKRCNFPKNTTTILKQWLSQNKDHPYPSEEEKCRLAGITNLSLRQVNDWMINARRRYLKNKKKYFGPK